MAQKRRMAVTVELVQPADNGVAHHVGDTIVLDGPGGRTAYVVLAVDAAGAWGRELKDVAPSQLDGINKVFVYLAGPYKGGAR